ncbi:uncharacterized protein PAN0_007c3220 [Moesziomyces antarcticus]|uniref:Uncharacterized protein n=1 Tax=Pseudozyma antarctica TaxID=84753 RepID=A0A081CEA8_PSEA2|nr:uncharacterized protein PAN0_007c3220 [Moesziomyces antarcticus]GAK65004.1 hypothetical protein PAN0_007c3220 [Moesziomyces antarcticus]
MQSLEPPIAAAAQIRGSKAISAAAAAPPPPPPLNQGAFPSSPNSSSVLFGLGPRLLVLPPAPSSSTTSVVLPTHPSTHPSPYRPSFPLPLFSLRRPYPRVPPVASFSHPFFPVPSSRPRALVSRPRPELATVPRSCRRTGPAPKRSIALLDGLLIPRLA